ncbi:hypothetical protein H5410_049995 [Solanum commersonii]|uniref:Uncharacterized protein n=1 Tax=Solanum commersonii TaxID=4109 RepID=A0A9J5WWL3_SOLCO|nr:hypothetical protein H5410_049995 [Solanum commersonii]
MLLQITYHDKATQTETEEEDTIEKILKAITTLSTKVDSMDNKIQKLKTNEDNLKSKASHKDDYKMRATPIGRRKNPELKGDEGNSLKPIISTTTQEPSQDYLTQKLQGYNKLIAQPKTNANLVRTCYNYGLLNTVYTYDGEELSGIPELHKTFITYKRVTKGNLFYVKFYMATTEILYEEIKPPIQVVKIGLTKDMIIPEDIGQWEIQKLRYPFYANKRIIGISTIIQELANNYLNENAIWSYYARYQLMIYSNSRELRKSDMDEVQRWILSLLKPEERPTTRALKEGFISAELLTRYCKLIGHRYPDHICSKCNGEDNIIPDVQLE